MFKVSKSKNKISVKETTNCVQSLYEKGLITYIRTDSNEVDEAIEREIKKYIIDVFGQDKIGEPKKTISKDSVQEGHPAITPFHIDWTPEEVISKNSFELNDHEIKLYKLIWQNTINSFYIKP